MKLAPAAPAMTIGFAIWPRSEATWAVLAARSVSGARIHFLDEFASTNEVPLCDLIVADSEKPGPQFPELYTALLASSGVLPLIVLGSPGDALLKMIPWEEHLTVFIPKPYRLEDLKAALHSMAARVGEETQQAASKITPRPIDYLSSLQLFDLTQMLCLNRWQGMVKVHHLSTGHTGMVCIGAGEVIHASCPAFSGEEAFYAMLCWGRCELALEERHPPVARSITTPWQHLLLEGAHRKDELEAKNTGAA